MNVRRLLLGIALCTGVATAADWPSLLPPRDLAARAGFDQHVGEHLPMEVTIDDQDGHATSLGQRAAGKPLLLAFGYYRCPNLCDLTLHGMAAAVSRMSLDVSRDYRVVFVSIDPHETALEARDAQAMLDGMNPAAHASEWTFATARAEAATALAGAAGFRYFLDPQNGQYAHPAGILIVTPDGRVAQYFFGVTYDPAALRLAIVDASDGKVGSVIDRLVLLCCGYDPATGRYSPLVTRVMIALGCAFLLAMAAGALWLRRRTP